MINFKNVVENTNLTNWWSNDYQQIAFSRGDKGFIAFTNSGNLKELLKTDMPSGFYCDIISGKLAKNGKCTGKVVKIQDGGIADVQLGDQTDGVLAIHINAKQTTK